MRVVIVMITVNLLSLPVKFQKLIFVSSGMAASFAGFFCEFISYFFCNCLFVCCHLFTSRLLLVSATVVCLFCMCTNFFLFLVCVLQLFGGFVCVHMSLFFFVTCLD